MTIKCINNSDYPALLTLGNTYCNASLVGPFYFFIDDSGTKGVFKKDYFEGITESEHPSEIGIWASLFNSPAVTEFNK